MKLSPRYWICLLFIAGLLFGGCAKEKSPRIVDLHPILGIPHYRNPVKAQRGETWKRRDLVFERVLFQGRSSDWIPGLICYSEMGYSHPLPALLCMPGSPNEKEDLLEPVDLLPRWADEGFFVISIDRPYHGEREGSEQQAVSEKGLLKVWGESVYDLMCTVDYLQSREEVDGERIGMLGLSMGGMEALLLGGIDRRIKVVVAVAGQLTWEEIFRGGYWKNIFQGLELRHELVRAGVSGMDALEQFRQVYPAMDLIDATELAARLAPRPLLIMSGEEDPIIPPAASRKVFERARMDYAKAQKEDHLELRIEPGVAHSFPSVLQDRALNWFKTWL